MKNYILLKQYSKYSFTNITFTIIIDWWIGWNPRCSWRCFGSQTLRVATNQRDIGSNSKWNRIDLLIIIICNSYFWDLNISQEKNNPICWYNINPSRKKLKPCANFQINYSIVVLLFFLKKKWATKLISFSKYFFFKKKRFDCQSKILSS